MLSNICFSLFFYTSIKLTGSLLPLWRTSKPGRVQSQALKSQRNHGSIWWTIILFQNNPRDGRLKVEATSPTFRDGIFSFKMEISTCGSSMDTVLTEADNKTCSWQLTVAVLSQCISSHDTASALFYNHFKTRLSTRPNITWHFRQNYFGRRAGSWIYTKSSGNPAVCDQMHVVWSLEAYGFPSQGRQILCVGNFVSLLGSFHVFSFFQGSKWKMRTASEAAAYNLFTWANVHQSR